MSQLQRKQSIAVPFDVDRTIADGSRPKGTLKDKNEFAVKCVASALARVSLRRFTGDSTLVGDLGRRRARSNIAIGLAARVSESLPRVAASRLRQIDASRLSPSSGSQFATAPLFAPLSSGDRFLPGFVQLFDSCGVYSAKSFLVATLAF